MFCFLFHIWYIGHWFILWGYSWYMFFILCFVKSRIYFDLLVFSTHAFMCLLSVSGIYRLIQLWLLSGHFKFEWAVCKFKYFIFVMCFVIDCQRGSLLGSKTLGTKCIRTSISNMLANHDQNIESRFRLA